MKKLLAILLLACSPAWAVTYYVCDCVTGADGACVAGSDANSAVQAQSAATPWQTLAKVNSAILGGNTTAAGDKTLFCKGGAWSGTSSLSFANVVSTATPSNPYVMDSYSPSWGGTAKPLLQFAAGDHGIYTGSFNNQNGILIQNLHIKGAATANGYLFHRGNGLFLYNKGYYVTARNLTIDGFDRGVSTLGDSGFIPHHIAIINSTIKNNAYSGLFTGEINNLRIEGNTFDNNGSCAYGTAFTDNVTAATATNPVTFTVSTAHSYRNTNSATLAGLPGSYAAANGARVVTVTAESATSVTYSVPLDGTAYGVYTSGGTSAHTLDCSGSGGGAPGNQHSVYINGGNNSLLRGNTIINSVANRSGNLGKCAGPPVTGHGVGKSWIWENNYVYEADGLADCYAIGYGDTYGTASEGITGFTIRGNTVAGKVGNFAFTVNASPGVIFENNVAALTGGSTDAFALVGKNFTGALNQSAAKVRNNSAYYASGTSTVAGAISFGNAGLFSSSTGTGNVVANNLVHIAAGSTANCWGVGVTVTGDYTAWDYNICFNAGTGTGGGVNTPFTGRQTNGITASPSLRNTPSAANSWDMCVSAGSNAVNAATATYAARLAIDGYKASGARDIGACEYGSNP